MLYKVSNYCMSPRGSVEPPKGHLYVFYNVLYKLSKGHYRKYRANKGDAKKLC